MPNPLYCATCTSHGEMYKAASFTVDTEAGEMRLCHHCHWLMRLQQQQEDVARAMQLIQEEILQVINLVNQNTLKITALCERFAGNN